jgi:hypothetical protein
MYASAAHWTIKEGSAPEALGIYEDDILPALEALPGFARSLIVQTGTDSFLSVACWDTEDDAKRAFGTLAPLSIRFLGHLVRGVERFPGQVVYERTSSTEDRDVGTARPADGRIGRDVGPGEALRGSNTAEASLTA